MSKERMEFSKNRIRSKNAIRKRVETKRNQMLNLVLLTLADAGFASSARYCLLQSKSKGFSAKAAGGLPLLKEEK